MSTVMLLTRLVQAPVIGMADLPGDIADWPKEWVEEFEERAGIMEFDGMLSRTEAEEGAETIVRAAYRVHHRAMVRNWKDSLKAEE
jgi:hypothetical protein